MKRTGLLLIVVLLVSLTGCATMFTKGGSEYRKGERALESGDFVQAASFAIQALDKNPEFEDARALLNQAFTQGTEQYEQAIASREASGEEFAYDAIFPLYETLERLHTTVAASKYAASFDIVSYAEMITESRERAAEAHYAVGVEALEAGDFRSARVAVVQFGASQAIIADYRDSADLMTRAREIAIITLLVYIPPEQQSLFGAGLGNQIIGSMAGREFTELVAPASLGISPSTSLEEAIEAAADADVDFVLSVNGSVSGEGFGPTIGNPTEFYPDTVGYSLAVGFESSLSGDFQLFDVAARESAVAGSIQVSTTDEISLRIFEPDHRADYSVPTDDEEEVQATFNTLTTTIAATGTAWSNSDLGQAITEAGFPYSLDDIAVCVPEVDMNELRAAGFYQLKEMLNGKIIFRGIEVVLIEEFAALPIYRYTDSYDGSGVEVMRQMSAKATEISDYLRDYGAAVAQEAAASGEGLAQPAARQIAEQLSPILQ